MSRGVSVYGNEGGTGCNAMLAVLDSRNISRRTFLHGMLISPEIIRRIVFSLSCTVYGIRTLDSEPFATSCGLWVSSHASPSPLVPPGSPFFSFRDAASASFLLNSYHTEEPPKTCVRRE